MEGGTEVGRESEGEREAGREGEIDTDREGQY